MKIRTDMIKGTNKKYFEKIAKTFYLSKSFPYICNNKKGNKV